MILVKPIASVGTPLLGTKMANGVAPIKVKSVILMEKVCWDPIMSLANQLKP